MKNVVILLVFCLIIMFGSAGDVFAGEENQFINIVNPVRISFYTRDPKESIKAQYLLISGSDLSATWLLTYDILTDDELVSVFLSMDDKQELGIFLEVGERLATDSEVVYNDTGSWHHATSVFLTGYTQKERQRMIDKVFERYKSRFGQYPRSVGSWWTDGYSLSYMKNKYNITANLGVADQFSTDGYQVWGQYWSTPYYPSAYHAGIPATTVENKLDLVTIQWAPRDPLNGYGSSLYSTQDYRVFPLGLDTDYFEKLVRLYGGRNKNEFGQVVVGLEGDLNPGDYSGEFKEQIEVVKKLENSGEFEVVTMSDFSNWYRRKFPGFSPPHVIEADDLLGEGIRVVWYQSPRYRIGIEHEYRSETTKIFDFRSYHKDFIEPYYFSPNKEFDLSIYIPSYFDEISNKEDVWNLILGKIHTLDRNGDLLSIIFDLGSKIVLQPEGFTIESDLLSTPEVILKSEALDVDIQENAIKIFPESDWLVPKDGLVFKDFSDIATNYLVSKRATSMLLVFIVVFVAIGFLIELSGFSDRKKLVMLTLLVVPVMIYSYYWCATNTVDYFVSQGEIDALYRLSLLPEGSVVVVDKTCLGCEWYTVNKPAVYANKRDYIRKLGSHPIVYNLSVFEASDQKRAREEFDKLNSRYIYLVKYNSYVEKIPFSPGDLGIEKIYDNANAEIWRLVE